MADYSSWFDGNWFNVVQTVGIVGSLWMTAAAANREAKAREIENLLTIAEQHREVWGELLKSQESERILQSGADALAKPLTPKEEENVNLVAIHFLKSWRIAKMGGLVTLKELATDARHFFSLPLPRAVWEKTKAFRNQRFVRFVDRAIERRGRLSGAGD
jgi:hypothetical protein